MSRGRKSPYKKSYCEQAYKLCLLGLTDKELAKYFNIAESTLNLWKKKHKEFSESVTRGKVIADAEVAESFLKRAVGYQYQEVHKEYKSGHGEDPDEVRVSKIITKEVAPDAGAALNWLKNRQGKLWRDKQEVKSTNTHKIKGKKPTRDELIAIINETSSS